MQEIDQHRNKILYGDCYEVLKTLQSKSVQMCVTSPPYYALREYGTAVWEGGDANCDHIEINSLRRDSPGGFHNSEARGTQPNTISVQKQYRDICGKCGAKRIDAQIGQEKTLDGYVQKMVNVFSEVKRVLRDDGILWLNLGDSYAGSGVHAAHHKNPGMSNAPHRGADVATPIPKGLKAKDLCGVPWRVAFALQEDGWWLRNEVIWSKPNPIPFPVTDRLVNAHESIFLLSKSKKYFYDAYAVKEPTVKDPSKPESHPFGKKGGKLEQLGDRLLSGTEWTNTGLRNKRDVWVVPEGSDESTALQWVLMRLNEIDPEIPALLIEDYKERCGNKTDVWRVTVKGTKEAHFACVDTETEALTPSGWKKQDELTDNELIAAYDHKRNVMCWQPATFHRYQYNGEMISIEKRDTSQLLTPNHRCLVRKRVSQGKKPTILKEKIINASDLNMRMELKTSAVWENTTGICISENTASLVGWYIAEGTKKSSKTVYIYQSLTTNPEKVEVIRNLLISVGAVYSERNVKSAYKNKPYTMVIFSIMGDIAQTLIKLCPNNHEMTPELANLPYNEACALLNALIDGDGHRRKDGRACIIQKNKRDIDLFQALAIRCGYRTILTKRVGKWITYALYLTRGEWLTLRGTNGQKYISKSVLYDGIVWCPNVKSSFWLARRNGKTFITGNTFNPELITPCILAGTSEKGACAVCGAPYKRVVVKEIDHLDPVDPIERHGIMLNPEDSAKVLWLEKTGGQYRISVIGDKHSHMWMDEPTKSGRTTQLKEKGYTLIWWGIKEGLKEDKEWKDKCGADSNGEYNGVSEKFLKQDALGKATQTGFNARWKEKQQNASDVKRRILEGMVATKTVAWEPTCACYNNKQKGIDIGQAPQSFVREDKIAVLRAKSREDAVKMYPNNPEQQKEYIRHVHDHGCSDPATMGKTVAWSASCTCDASENTPCIVLDPFMGSGTTAIVAQSLGRDYIGIELNKEYIIMAERRIIAAQEKAELVKKPKVKKT